MLANFRLALAQRLRSDGHDVTLVCPHGEHTSVLRDAGFDPVHWDVARRGMRPDRERRSVTALREILDDLSPDLVQAFTIKPNLYAPLAAPEGVPVLALFSGLGWAFGDDAKARVVQAALRPVARRAFIRRPDVHLATQNAPDRDRLVAAGWAKAEQVTVLPNGIEVDRFLRPPDKPRPDTGPLRLITACRLLRDKGVTELVEAVTRLRADGRDVIVTVAGSTDVGNPRTLTDAEIARMASNDGVTFSGHVREIEGLLHQAEVAVLATSYNEGTPRFLLEAGAAGLALVGSDIAGVRRAVTHDENGKLVPAGDVDALVAVLARLDDDRAEVRRLGDAATARVRRDHNEADVIDAYLSWYDEVGVLPKS